MIQVPNGKLIQTNNFLTADNWNSLQRLSEILFEKNFRKYFLFLKSICVVNTLTRHFTKTFIFHVNFLPINKNNNEKQRALNITKKSTLFFYFIYHF